MLFFIKCLNLKLNFFIARAEIAFYQSCFLQLNYPDKVDGLVLVNCTAKQAGWVEWGYQKVCVFM